MIGGIIELVICGILAIVFFILSLYVIFHVGIAEGIYIFIIVGLLTIIEICLYTNIYIGVPYKQGSEIISVMNNDSSIIIDTLSMDKDGKIYEVRIRKKR